MAKRITNDLLMYRLNEMTSSIARLEEKVDKLSNSVLIMKVKMAVTAAITGFLTALGVQWYRG